jgi:hypothetical protein
MSSSTNGLPPSDRQINYLKSLAEQTGTSFTYPKTRRQASSEIDRLIQLKNFGCTYSPEPVEAAERGAVYATAVADHEVSGYGSTATWSRAPVDDPLCVCGHRLSKHSGAGDTRCLAVEHRADLIGAFDDGRDSDIAYCECLRFDDGSESLRTGERTELARYSVSGGERVLYGQRINGTVRITDRPAAGDGRSFLVERELEQDGYSALKALIADYIEQAHTLDAIPMESSTVRYELEQRQRADA